MKGWNAVPGRASIVRPDFLWLVLAAVLLPGCGRSSGHGGGRTIRLDSGIITLPLGAHAWTVTFTGGAGSERVDPPTTRARPGDAVRFVAGDGLTHAIVFDTTAMSADARAFLARTGQVSGPPLIAAGSEWVVSLRGAPPGDYPFHCRAHGGRGRLVVAGRH